VGKYCARWQCNVQVSLSQSATWSYVEKHENIYHTTFVWGLIASHAESNVTSVSCMTKKTLAVWKSAEWCLKHPQGHKQPTVVIVFWICWWFAHVYATTRAWIWGTMLKFTTNRSLKQDIHTLRKKNACRNYLHQIPPRKQFLKVNNQKTRTLKNSTINYYHLIIIFYHILSSDFIMCSLTSGLKWLRYDQRQPLPSWA
jgi:hypothetical protein